MTLASALLLACLLACLAWERLARDRALAAIPIRIHVNGTRGKSTTTRLIAGALREAGIPTLAKTTGTEACVILPDGSDQPIRRRGPASIREQLWFLRLARQHRAAAVVVECMAIDPGLQAVCERDMIRSTIGVITNVRHDHGDVMGRTLDDVGSALSHTVPRRGVLVLGPSGGTAPIREAALRAGTRVVDPDTAEEIVAGPGQLPAWMAENVAVALAAAREAGVLSEVARRGMARALPDPGAVRSSEMAFAGRLATVIDATAANDPESLSSLLGPRTSPAVFLFHHREDRPCRLRQFAETPPWTRGDDVLLITGGRPAWSTMRRARRTAASRVVEFVSRRRLGERLEAIASHAHAGTTVVLCGNTRGFPREALFSPVRGVDRG